MEQVKCGNVYRDLDGNFNYTCTCCSFEFMSAMDFEEHVVVHLDLNLDGIKEEESPHEELSQDVNLKIEPVYEDAQDIQYDEQETDDEEYIMDNYEIQTVKSVGAEDFTDARYEKVDAFFTCDCCDRLYACNGLKQQHIHKYADENKSCKKCPAYYEKESELNAHKKIHNLADTLSCPDCFEIFASPNKLKRHMTPNKPQTSPHRKKTAEKIQVKVSESNDENEAGEDDELEAGGKKRNKFICGICHKEYSYLYYLKKHLKRHSENTLNHACSVCGHEFKLRQNLTAHMRTHTGERPFKCKLCSKSFNQPYYMTIHMRIHQKEKPYQCTLCGVSFVTSSHLGRHMKSHNNIRPHKCSICDRAFILPGHLQDHMRSQHTGERPFTCDVCGNTFSRRKLLRQHAQLHGEKRFKCKYCDLVFSQSAGRRGHEIRVHNAA